MPCNLQKLPSWTSLVIQWVRIHLPVQGTWVQSLVWEDSTCLGETKPVHYNYWACVLQLLKLGSLEPVLHKRNQCSEKPMICNKEKPLLTTKEVSKCWSLSRAQLFAAPWTAAHQAPLSMRFSRQGYWSRLPFPSPGDLPNPGIEPGSPALQVDSLPTELQGKPIREKPQEKACA